MLDGRIVSWAPYGQHIPLRCINHSWLRWHTKNISPLGCRNIFYASDEPECTCPGHDLRPVPTPAT
jgi:hypothetical protein